MTLQLSLTMKKIIPSFLTVTSKMISIIIKEDRLSIPLVKCRKVLHSLSLKAWDNFNNSSEASITFIVKTDKGFILNNLINYPNPFTNQTSITVEHNRPDENLNIRINIYNMSGKIIRIIETAISATGYKLPPITWDGKMDGGMKTGRGVYPYTVTISTENGEIARASGRMVIL